ncbi:MAG TPA: TraR/DksA C4-type zinc finger protein [Candidatus Hydrogenedentes bacterium]|nr:TraR/DksA C4-type zinc finger protein [Candidatus Hydrogenedentota bacterium]HPG70022.1 TraR/DksA C4-type zinc finger protein [Candidatus Hydrogenedentota bacterium]
MNRRDAKKFEKVLQAEYDRLTEGIRRIEETTRTESGGQGAGGLSSYAEVGTDNFERETALHIASGESQWLNEITDALKRIEEGSYGVCEGCGEQIPKKRLDVFPSARYCIECQSKLERGGVL